MRYLKRKCRCLEEMKKHRNNEWPWSSTTCPSLIESKIFSKKIFLRRKDQRSFESLLNLFIVYRCYRRTNAVEVDRSFLVVNQVPSLLDCYSCLFLLNEGKIIVLQTVSFRWKVDIGLYLDYDRRTCGGTNRTRWRIFESWFDEAVPLVVTEKLTRSNLVQSSSFVDEFHSESTYQIAKIDRLRKVSQSSLNP